MARVVLVLGLDSISHVFSSLSSQHMKKIDIFWFFLVYPPIQLKTYPSVDKTPQIYPSVDFS